jgi:hypothetical protein
VKLGNQRSLLLIVFLWVLASLIGGFVAGIQAAPHFTQSTQIIVTNVNVHELVITQIIGGPTYTPYPTYTQLPSTPTATRRFIKQATPSATWTLPVITPTPTPSGLQLVDFSWNAFPDHEAFIEIRTTPGNICTIEYADPQGNTFDYAELNNQLADENGLCIWKWIIAKRTKTGSATVTVAAGGKSATYLLQILSSTPPP